jgi:hypothetical protein
MKKFICLLVIGTLLQIEVPEVQARVSSEPASWNVTSEQSLLKKRKRYRNRQRKGFLGGIFRKKSGCGCPNN